jgi:amino acid transporter
MKKERRKENSTPSLDAMLMFGIWILFMLGVIFADGFTYGFHVLSILLAIAISAACFISFQHRRRHRWQWPGVKSPNIGLAVGALLSGIFVMVFSLGAMGAGSINIREVSEYLVNPSQSNPKVNQINHELILLIFGIGFIAFWNVLVALKLVHNTEDDFYKSCSQQDG